MIVAVINQTAPVGQVRVNTFLDAADEAAAVAAYVDTYDPPLDPADWLGYEPELSPGNPWPAWQSPGAGKNWFYDFGAPGLVAVSNTAQLEAAIKEQLLADPLDGFAITTVVAGLQVTTNIENLIVDDITTIVADPTDTKFLRISYVYDEDADSFSVEAYEKTTGQYAPYLPPEYLVRELGEWSVIAGGSVLVPV